MDTKVLIIGAGHAGIETAASLRNLGFSGKIEIFDQENTLPYQKPPLSKSYIKSFDTKEALLRSKEWYVNNKINLKLNTNIKFINHKNKSLSDEKDNLSVGMLGMHGTAYANFAVTECDLLIAIGARFDDRVTGKLDTFAPNAKVIHIDIDPAEVNKNRRVDVAIVSDVSKAVLKINEQSLNNKFTCKTKNWLEKIDFWKNKHPLYDPPKEGEIYPQEVLIKVRELTPEAYVTTDVGQHQMWAAQYLRNSPR